MGQAVGKSQSRLGLGKPEIYCYERADQLKGTPNQRVGVKIRLQGVGEYNVAEGSTGRPRRTDNIRETRSLNRLPVTTPEAFFSNDLAAISHSRAGLDCAGEYQQGVHGLK